MFADQIGYRLKAAIQRIIAMLPDRQAHAAYYYIQRRWGRLQQVDPLPYFEQALNLISHAQAPPHP